MFNLFLLWIDKLMQSHKPFHRRKSHVRVHKGRNDHPRPEMTSNPYRVLWGFKESEIERERDCKLGIVWNEPLPQGLSLYRWLFFQPAQVFESLKSLHLDICFWRSENRSAFWWEMRSAETSLHLHACFFMSQLHSQVFKTEEPLKVMKATHRKPQVCRWVSFLTQLRICRLMWWILKW